MTCCDVLQQHQGLPFAPSSSRPQQCTSTQELVNSLRQVEKMLAINEASFQQGLRALRKKMSILQNSTMAIVQNSGETKRFAVVLSRRSYPHGAISQRHMRRNTVRSGQ